MIFDSHTHIGFGGLIKAKTTELLSSMKMAGIQKAAVFAGAINECSTEQLLEVTKDYKGTLYPVGSISPFSPSKPSLKKVEGWLKEEKVFGLKFYVGYEYFYPNDKAIRDYLKLLQKYERPAIFHSGDLYNRALTARLKYAHPLQIDDLAATMPKLKIIIAHMGFPWIIDAVEVVYKNKNVYCDCSGFVYGTFGRDDKTELAGIFKRILGKFELDDRLLFGTDWPISNQSDYVKIVSALSGKCKRKIMSKNAEAAFAIKL